MLYFFPNEKGIPGASGKDALLRRCGLREVIGDTSMPYRQSSGPGGHAGIVVDTSADERAIIDMTAQTWTECAGGAFWYGYWTERKPGPNELGRRSQVDGHLVRLSDGNDWLVPLVRAISGGTKLPRVIRFTPDGRTVLDVHSGYQAFYDMGMTVWDEFLLRERYAENLDSLLPVTIAALTVNYRVGKWEAGALGLIDTQNILQIAHAIIDGPAIDAYMHEREKKTESGDTAGNGLTPGGAD